MLHSWKEEVGQGAQEAESLNQRVFCKDNGFSREVPRFVCLEALAGCTVPPARLFPLQEGPCSFI